MIYGFSHRSSNSSYLPKSVLLQMQLLLSSEQPELHSHIKKNILSYFDAVVLRPRLNKFVSQGLGWPQIHELIIILMSSDRLDSAFQENLADRHLKILRIMADEESRYIKNTDYDAMAGFIACAYPYLRSARVHPNLLPKKFKSFAQKRLQVFLGELWGLRSFYGDIGLWRSYYDGKFSPRLSLGGAHGIPSIMRFLAACKASSIESRYLDVMIQDIITFAEFIRERYPSGRLPSHYPQISPPFRFPVWCYSGFSWGIQFFYSGHEMGNRTIREIGLHYLTAAARMRPSRALTDPVLCHGTVGNAYLFQKLFFDTQSELFLKAGLDWEDQFVASLTKQKVDRSQMSSLGRFPLVSAVGVDLGLNTIRCGMSDFWNYLMGIRHETV